MGKIIVASGLDAWGEVTIESEDSFGSHGWTVNRRKVQESKKGKFVIVNKKRVYITIPENGSFERFDNRGERDDNGCLVKWVGETITIEY